mmetsp:Transcript_3425/g.5075  ORF Transcript_3425/g.5075 Transcript_3425/m.5075 type:complete len:95 (-) Transcript_3425:695-979(-)
MWRRGFKPTLGASGRACCHRNSRLPSGRSSRVPVRGKCDKQTYTTSQWTTAVRSVTPRVASIATESMLLSIRAPESSISVGWDAGVVDEDDDGG